jgi:hypothetical protein
MNFFTTLWVRMRDMYALRYEPEGVQPLGTLYWRTLLIIAFIVVWLAVLYGIWDLTGVLSTLANMPDTSPPPSSGLSKSALDKLVQGFDARQSAFNSFGTRLPPAVADPSR